MENEKLEIFKQENGGHWGECPRWTVSEWMLDVAHGHTRLGYWEWALQLEESEKEFNGTA